MRRIATVATFVLLLATMAWVPAAEACLNSHVPAASQPTDSASGSVICLINHRRQNHGLRSLSPSVTLWNAAQVHSDAMDSQDFFSHDGPDGGPVQRAAAAGYLTGARDWSIGENLGYGANSGGSPRAMVAAWMRSAEHRGVILEPSWREIGVGVADGSPLGADGPGMATYTVDLGYRRG
jgi:uncharacterized protein YkwD